MAYRVRRGTKVIARKPSGELVEHTFRAERIFDDDEKVAENKTLQFTRDGFLILVWAADVAEIVHRCPQCGTSHGIEGLCDACRMKWLPR